MKNVGNALFRSHSEVATAIKLGHRDAGVMWNGVAHTFRDSLQVVPAPYEYDEEIRVHIIGLNYSKQPEPVRQFIEFARQKGPTIFAEYGYVK